MNPGDVGARRCSASGAVGYELQVPSSSYLLNDRVLWAGNGAGHPGSRLSMS